MNPLGFLIESFNPTFLYGTASGHSVLYQYQVYGASNLFMGMIQTESPYYQVSPPAPAPFTSAVGLYNGDPTFSDCTPGSPSCAFSWSLMVQQSTNILIYVTGLYSCEYYRSPEFQLTSRNAALPTFPDTHTAK